MIKDVDKSTVLDANAIENPVLGVISPEKLSAGVKELLLMKTGRFCVIIYICKLVPSVLH